MNKHIIIAAIFTVTCSLHSFCQTPPAKIPAINGNVNDWEHLFNDAQNKQLDSVITAFSNKTNAPMILVTMGSAVTPLSNIDNFTMQVDSVFHNNHNILDMAIFLSKEFRKLTINAQFPSNVDTAQMQAIKERVQQLFQEAAKPYIPLLKEGKYAEALMGTITDLADAIKKG